MPAGARLPEELLAVLDRLAGMPFDEVVRSGELAPVEAAVLEQHRLACEARGEPWSPPAAYRWMRYESPDPIASLRRAIEALRPGWRGC